MIRIIPLTKDNKYFEEAKELFEKNKHISDYKSLEEAIAEGFFFIALSNDFFIGCLFLHDWGDDEVYLSGFSKRKVLNTTNAIRLLTYFTFKDYPHINKILMYICKDNKPALLCSKRAGFKILKEKDNNYILNIERQ